MAGVVHLLTSVLGELRRVIEEDRKRHGQLKIGLEVIMNEMEMVLAMIEGYKEYHETRQAKLILQQLQELVYDVDDFVAGLRVRGPSASGLFLTAAGMDPRPQYLQRIDGFRKTIKDLKGLTQTEASTLRSGQGGHNDKDCHSAVASGTIAGSASSTSPQRYTPSDDLVGIDKPMADLLELILTPSSEQNDTRQKLRVISIVGSRGMGKTALARAIYEHPRVYNKFHCVAWVEGSDCCYSVDQLWCKVVETLRTETGATASANLHGILADKRYLVIIDDVQRADVWKEIVDVFPGNEKGSRIVVTTTLHSVANACSSGSYVFRMQYLGQAESEDLFWRRVYGGSTSKKPSENLIIGSKGILSKCGGSPLALTSVANYLSIKSNHLNKSYCEYVGQNLGRDYLSGNSAVNSFRQLRKVLVEHYNSLPDYDHRTYVLYLSIFPEGHQINNKSLIRKLEAEGLVSKDGYKCFDELIDQCTIDPVLIGSNCKFVNKCLVHGVVLEHIIEMSVSKNFVTLMHKQDKLRKVDSAVARVRRLSIQSTTKERYSDVEDKSAIRSLTIFKSDLFDFQSCKMLRLLDLEGCEGLDKRILHVICDLLLLRYLSLRKTDIHELPSKIKKLRNLHTLDIRGTQVKTLPMEVIVLPKLAYLFGKFELPKMPIDKLEIEQFFRMKSELQTLSGFVIKNKQGIGHIVLMARKLTRVKMWCEDTLDISPAQISASVPAPVPSNSVHDPGPARAPAPNGTPGDLPTDPSGPRHARSSIFGSSLQTCVPCLNGGNQVVQPEANPPALDAPLQTNNSFSAPNGAIAAATSLTTSNAVAVDSSSQINLEDLVSSLKQRSTVLESVSLDSSRLCKDFLGTLKGPSTISSIKLRGQLDGLPDSITLCGLCNLTKLQLISTGLSSHDLSDLQSLSCLEYLKLAEHRDGFWDGRFIVKENGFESLHHLCLEAPKLPKLQFKQGAMRSLTSLQLLCPAPPITMYFSASHQLQESVEGLFHLTNLNKVILHHSTSEAAMQAWKTAANRHINRPYMTKQSKPDNNEV